MVEHMDLMRGQALRRPLIRAPPLIANISAELSSFSPNTGTETFIGEIRAKNSSPSLPLLARHLTSSSSPVFFPSALFRSAQQRDEQHLTAQSTKFDRSRGGVLHHRVPHQQIQADLSLFGSTLFVFSSELELKMANYCIWQSVCLGV
ncbi:tetratricopeptide repeat protein [Striga asiatica]|uniref:Tetratricopeptide repeat protein n=1 Tax=Striga asiatica TaxID=4170 RepID=A0A5A7R5W4_STRAF|nr:tetratricopeptide repeat protein [Striga asiatica]